MLIAYYVLGHIGHCSVVKHGLADVSPHPPSRHNIYYRTLQNWATFAGFWQEYGGNHAEFAVAKRVAGCSVAVVL